MLSQTMWSKSLPATIDWVLKLSQLPSLRNTASPLLFSELVIHALPLSS